MRKVMISGVGMTSFGKFADGSVRSLAVDAVTQAVADAGAQLDDVEAVFFGNAVAGLITGQEMIRAQQALRHTGLMGRPMVNVENACASGSTAFHLAWMAVACGQYEVALAVGSEKMTHPDKRVSLGALEAAVDLVELEELKKKLGAQDGGKARSIFMDIYAERSRAFMARTGATAEDFARIAVKSHRFGALNPKAQYRETVSVEEVLASRAIASPITLLMCAPIGDGAAAVLVTSESYARKIGARAVEVRASVLVTGSGDSGQPPAATRASRKAYEMAGVGPEAIDVVELHDATAPSELMLYETLGLCAPGEAPSLLRSGATDLGGRMPVNPSGGLLSRGHPVGATGCAQLVELTQQLRGDAGERQRTGAKVGLAQNGGGTVGPDSAAMTVTVLAN
jgi:acetyl-CoA acyltransferase